MNIFEEFGTHIEAFKDTRDHVVNSAALPPTYREVSFGKPPFAVEDGDNYYAVIDETGTVSPLPFGYQVSADDIEMDGVGAVLSVPMPAAESGFARYVPLVRDFEIPGDRAFCLEIVEDSEAWAAVGRILDAFQKVVNERAALNFNQRLANKISRIYEDCDELESVDQAISALYLQRSALPVLLLRSYRHALEPIEEELREEEEEEDENEE